MQPSHVISIRWTHRDDGGDRGTDPSCVSEMPWAIDGTPWRVDDTCRPILENPKKNKTRA
jgi:hypothetical protein